MNLYDSYQISKKGKNIPFSAFLLLVPTITVFLLYYITDGGFFLKTIEVPNTFSESTMQMFGMDAESLNNNTTDIEFSLSEVFIDFIFNYLFIYLFLQVFANLIGWLISKIKGKSYSINEYEVLLLIPILLYYNANGIIFTSVILALTIFTYWFYLSSSKQKEEQKD